MSAEENDLREWVAAYLTQTLTVDEAGAFNQRLREDSAARRYMAEQCRQDVMLRQCLASREFKQGNTARLVRQAAKQKTRSHTRQRSRSRRQPVTPFYAAAAAAAAVLLFVIYGMLQSQPRVVHETQTRQAVARVERGSAQFYSATGQQRLLADGQAFQNGRWEAGSESLQLRLQHERTRLLLTADSVVDMQVHNNGSTWTVHRGTLHCEVAKQPAGAEFLVKGRLGEVHVVGTALTVESNAGRMYVHVDSGAVMVLEYANNQQHRLEAGASMELRAASEQEAKPEEEAPPQPAPLQWSEPVIESLSLIDPDTNTVVTGYEALVEDFVLDREKLSLEHYNLRINTDPRVDMVTTEVNAAQSKELFRPFSLFSDTDGDYKRELLRPGVYKVQVQAYYRNQRVGRTFTLQFTVK